MKPDDPSNIKKIEDGHEGAYREINAADFVAGMVKLTDAEGAEREYRSAELMMDTTVTARGLTVTAAYTTTSESSSQQGAMTLTCIAPDGTGVTVRTAVLYDAAGKLIGADEYNASPVNNPSQEALDHCEVFKYLGDDTKLYDQVWTEIISEF